MIAGSPEAPVLVLGLGNLLLKDDGVGLRLLEELRREEPPGGSFEFVDGGTQGIALLGRLENRTTAVILDAVRLGAPPGTVHVLRAADLPVARSGTAHEGNAVELLALAKLLGRGPEEVVILGIEPRDIRTGIGLSDDVERAIPEALVRARELLNGAGRRLQPGLLQRHNEIHAGHDFPA